ncbi:hypothetical protein LINGRAHAP2_LOCUS37060, partial [Linum grandiflorum]
HPPNSKKNKSKIAKRGKTKLDTLQPPIDLCNVGKQWVGFYVASRLTGATTRTTIDLLRVSVCFLPFSRR